MVAHILPAFLSTSFCIWWKASQLVSGLGKKPVSCRASDMCQAAAAEECRSTLPLEQRLLQLQRGLEETLTCIFPETASRDRRS